MKRFTQRKSQRRAVSGLISAIFLFAMLFTTGAAYILFVTDSQFKLQDAAQSALDRGTQRMEELARIDTSKNSNSRLNVSVTNIGTEPFQVKQLMVLDSSSAIKNITTLNPPKTLNIQDTWSVIFSNIMIQEGSKYAVKVVTDRGSVFPGSYPPINYTSIYNSAVSAEIAKSIGAIMMDTTSLQYSQNGGTTWNQGWIVPGGVDTIWRVNVTNLSTRNIYLANYSSFLFLKVVSGGGGQLQPASFYIVKNASATTYPKLDSNFIADGGVMVPANAGSVKILYLKTTQPNGGFPQKLDSGNRYMTVLELFGKYDSPTSSSYYGQSLPFEGVICP